MALNTLAISAWSIGGSVIADLEGGTIEVTGDDVRNDSVTQGMESRQLQKRQVAVDSGLMTTLTNPDRVSDLNVTALTLGGNNLLTYGVQDLSLNIGYTRAEVPQLGSRWRVPQNVKITISGEVTWAIPDAGTFDFLADMFSATHSDVVKVLSVTINGVSVTLPTLLTGLRWSGERDGLQLVTASLSPRAPAGGAYPTAPTGTTSLLEKALNDFRTPLTCSFVTKAVGGRNIAGDFIFDTVSLEVRDAELVMTRYRMISTGAVTGVLTT
jgi:hypothetical protein